MRSQHNLTAALVCMQVHMQLGRSIGWLTQCIQPVLRILRTQHAGGSVHTHAQLAPLFTKGSFKPHLLDGLQMTAQPAQASPGLRDVLT